MLGKSLCLFLTTNLHIISFFRNQVKNFDIKLNTEFVRRNFMLVYLVLSYYEIQLNIIRRDKGKGDIVQCLFKGQENM